VVSSRGVASTARQKSCWLLCGLCHGDLRFRLHSQLQKSPDTLQSSGPSAAHAEHNRLGRRAADATQLQAPPGGELPSQGSIANQGSRHLQSCRASLAVVVERHKFALHDGPCLSPRGVLLLSQHTGWHVHTLAWEQPGQQGSRSGDLHGRQSSATHLQHSDNADGHQLTSNDITA